MGLGAFNAVMASVLVAMDNHPAVPDIQWCGCSLMHALFSFGDKAGVAVVSGGVERVLTAMKAHLESASVQQAACDALRWLWLCHGNWVRVLDAGGVELAFAAIRRYGDGDSVVARAALALLGTMAQKGKHRAFGMIANGLQDLYALITWRDEKITLLTCQLLAKLAGHRESAVLIVLTAGLGSLCDAIVANMSVANVVTACLDAVNGLVKHVDNAVALLPPHGIALLVGAMLHHVTSVTASERAVSLLLSLVAFPAGVSALREGGHAVAVLVCVKGAHADVAAIVSGVDTVLRVLVG